MTLIKHILNVILSSLAIATGIMWSHNWNYPFGTALGLGAMCSVGLIFVLVVLLIIGHVISDGEI